MPTQDARRRRAVEVGVPLGLRDDLARERAGGSARGIARLPSGRRRAFEREPPVEHVEADATAQRGRSCTTSSVPPHAQR